MAGHSQFKNIMHRKGVQDVKKAKIFNKLGREITVAAKMGLPDPAMNPRLARRGDRGTAEEHADGPHRPGDQKRRGRRRGGLRIDPL